MASEPEAPTGVRRWIETVNGHAIVSNYAIHCGHFPWLDSSASPDDPAMHTGHVWAEVKCGMGVNRINVTPDEARRIAAMLVEVADAMDEAGAIATVRDPYDGLKRRQGEDIRAAERRGWWEGVEAVARWPRAEGDADLADTLANGDWEDPNGEEE